MENNIDLVTNDGVVTITGSLNFSTMVEIQTKLTQEIRNAPAQFTVEFSQLKQLNSAAITFMLECQRIALRLNKQCIFANIPEKLNDMLKLAGLSSVIQQTVTQQAGLKD